MNKKIFIGAVMLSTTLLANAGVLNDNFTALCTKTGMEVMDVPEEQFNGTATNADVKNMKLAMADSTQAADIKTTISAWNPNLMAMTVDKGGESVTVFIAPMENSNRQECVVVASDQNEGQNIVIYMEGNEHLIEAINLDNM